MPHDPAPPASLDQALDIIVAQLGGRRSGAAASCRCPAHDDRHPSLSVRIGARRLLVKCFAGCPAAAVLAALRARGLPVRSAAAAPSTPRRGDPAAAARRLWSRAMAVANTPAARYLAARGLAPPHPAVRYLARTPLGSGAEQRWLPALLIVVEDEAGITGLQRLFLDEVTGGKRVMDAPRRSLGHLGGGAVRLAPPDDVLGLAEGYETARAAQLLLGLPVWATLGAERLARIALPASVRRLLLLPDRDAAGRAAAVRAAAAYRAQGVAVETRWPPVGWRDWAEGLPPLARASG